MQCTRLILFVAVLTISRVGRTELILDDFNDAASAVSPAMLDDFVETLNVGNLGAKRSIRIAGAQAEPEGWIDVNAGGNSSFVASLDQLNAANSTLSKLVSIQTNYAFSTSTSPLSGKDVTEGGRNNAIVLDVRRLSSAVSPRFLQIIVQDQSDSFVALLAPPPLGDKPFSIVIPFESFGFRGGGVGLPDFSAIRTLNVELRVVSGAGPEDLAFRMDLDRIRFSRIPEPAGEALIVLGLAVVGCMRRASRRLS